MNLRFVEAFWWVASLKSVTRAAEKLHVTQSAMSSRIASLEDELGTLLLDRRRGGFRLTPAGARFLVHAERLLDLQRQAKSEMGSTSDAEPSAMQLRIGAIESVLHSWLIPWIAQLREAQPAIQLELTVETTPILVEQVRRGTQDIVFAAAPGAGDGVRSRALPSMEMVFLGHTRFHRKRRYGLADLAMHELLTFQRGSQPHVALLDLFRQAGVDAPRVHAISSVSAMLQLVQGGFGIATLPASALARLTTVPELRRLASETPLQPLPIHASWRTDPSGVAVEALVRSAATFVTPPSPTRAAARQTRVRSAPRDEWSHRENR